jgi:RNA polymerase sigma-70 factor (ECF subfamily)
LPADDKQAFVAALVRDHGQRLRRFLAARLRNATTDVPDLVQEVYLRLLRMPRHETIRSPQAYLFTIAHHVLYEHRLHQSATPEAVQMTDVLAEIESYVEEDPATHLETHQRLEQLDNALKEISPRAYATFVLHRRYGYSLEEIAGQLGVSRPMVKKYLAKAVIHCRRRFDGVK